MQNRFNTENKDKKDHGMGLNNNGIDALDQTIYANEDMDEMN